MQTQKIICNTCGKYMFIDINADWDDIAFYGFNVWGYDEDGSYDCSCVPCTANLKNFLKQTQKVFTPVTYQEITV